MALQIFGTDFSMIEKVFNGERSREQIKVSVNLNTNNVEQIQEGREKEQESHRQPAQEQSRGEFETVY